jgi:phosphonopyruvate decarboxylase
MISGPRAVETIREARSEQVVVTTMTGLGFWPEAGDRDFRLLGLMGAAGSIGLGLAVARPELGVWVIDGDGSLLMQLGLLSAVADAAPPGFVHIVIANGVYGVSGAQPLPAQGVFDWAGCALACGYRDAAYCTSAEDLRHELTSTRVGPRLVVVECEPTQPAYLPGAFAIDARREGERLRASLDALGNPKRRRANHFAEPADATSSNFQ